MQLYQASPRRVPDTPVSAGNIVYEAFFCEGGNRVGLLFIVFLAERECVERNVEMKDGLASTFYFLHASIEKKLHLSSPITTKAS